jgi:hypothetical protein
MNPASVPATPGASHTSLASEETQRDVSSSTRGGLAISDMVLNGRSTIPSTRKRRNEYESSGPNKRQDAELFDQVTSLATSVLSEDIGRARNDNHARGSIFQTINGVSATDGSSLFAGINVTGAPPDQPHFFYQPSYESYKNLNPRRVAGTCEWVFEHPTFKWWRDSDHNELLWLSADPGCGKSVISRALVDEDLGGGDSAATGYYFFKDNEQQRGAARAVCTLLYQIFASRQHLFCKHAIPAIKRRGFN